MGKANGSNAIKHEGQLAPLQNAVNQSHKLLARYDAARKGKG
jgi:hypothetical protein